MLRRMRDLLFFDAAPGIGRSLAVATGVLLLSTGATWAATAAVPLVPQTASPELKREVEAYRLCTTISLPSDFKRVKDSAAAVAVALEKCKRQRLAVAGQFALDNPGTPRTKAFVDELSVRMVEDLSGWIEDVDASRTPPDQPPYPSKHLR